MTPRNVIFAEWQRDKIIELLYKRGETTSYDYICSYLSGKGFSNQEGDVKYLLDELSKEGAVTSTKVSQTRSDDLYTEGQIRYTLTESGRFYYEFWKEYSEYWSELMELEDKREYGLYGNPDDEYYLSEDLSEEKDWHGDSEWRETIKNPELMARFFDRYKIKT